MVKKKNHSGAKKRFFGVTAKHRQANRSHINSKRSGVKTLALRKNALLSGKQQKKILTIIS